MELLNVYQQTLAAAGLKVINDVVHYNAGDHVEQIWTPVTIGGKVLHQPTQDFLKNPDWETYIAYHPLSENPMRGESEVLKVLRGFMVSNFNQVLMHLMEKLVGLAVDTDGHKRLSATASECLDTMPKADAKSVKDLGKVMAQLDKDSPAAMSEVLDRLGNTSRRKLVNYYLKRGGKYKNKEFGRVAVVDFPIIATDNEEGNYTIFGVKLRKNDYIGFRKLFEFIVDTDESNGEKYNSGTNTMTAPYLTVLLESWFKLAKRLNKLLKLYTKYIPEFEYFKFDTSWESALELFGELAKQVPALEGNRGVVPQDEEQPQEQQATAAPAPAAKRNLNSMVPKVETVSVATAAPVMAPAPAPVMAPPAQAQQPMVYNQQAVPAATQVPESTGGLSWAELKAQKQAQQQQQQPQPYYQQPMQQPQYYQQPQFQQQNNWAGEALNPQQFQQQNGAPWGNQPQQPANPLRAGYTGQNPWGAQPQQNNWGQPNNFGQPQVRLY